MRHYRSLLPLLALALAALACNLGTSSAPPTLVPRLTDTPYPTIAYATLSPNQLPQQQQQVVTAPSLSTNLGGLLDQIDTDRMMAHIQTLQDMRTRHVNSGGSSTTGIDAAYSYILRQFEAIRSQSQVSMTIADPSFKLEWEGVTSTQRNIVAYMSGQTDGGIILVGAHYDSITRNPQDAVYYAPGANDNGSGIAAMLEIARIMSQQQHRATIIFVAFAAEEVGRLGSIELAKWVRNNNIAVDAMINMDIIGSQTGPNGSITSDRVRLFAAGPNNSGSRQLARSAYFAAFNYVQDMRIDIQPDDYGDRQGRYGDHLSFSEMGIPAVRFIEVEEDVARQHTPNDTIDDIQPAYLNRVTRVVLATLTVLADGLPPPNADNVVFRQNDQGTRTLVWEPVEGATGYMIGLRQPGSLKIDNQFPWPTNSVDWAGFTAAQFETLIISSIDASGLIGPPTREIIVPP